MGGFIILSIPTMWLFPDFCLMFLPQPSHEQTFVCHFRVSFCSCVFSCVISVCHFVLVLFSPFSIAITSLGEERANLSAFRTFVRFVRV